MSELKDIVATFNELNLKLLNSRELDFDELGVEEYEELMVEIVDRATLHHGTDLGKCNVEEQDDGVRLVLTHDDCKYGWLKGDLPSKSAIKRAVDAHF